MKNLKILNKFILLFFKEIFLLLKYKIKEFLSINMFYSRILLNFIHFNYN